MPTDTLPLSAANRIARLARVMEIATLAGIGLVGALSVLALLIPGWTRNLVLARLGSAGLALPLTPGGRAGAAVVIAVPVGVMLYGLLAVRRMFAEFARGEVFTARAAQH